MCAFINRLKVVCSFSIAALSMLVSTQAIAFGFTAEPEYSDRYFLTRGALMEAYDQYTHNDNAHVDHELTQFPLIIHAFTIVPDFHPDFDYENHPEYRDLGARYDLGPYEDTQRLIAFQQEHYWKDLEERIDYFSKIEVCRWEQLSSTVWKEYSACNTPCDNFFVTACENISFIHVPHCPAGTVLNNIAMECNAKPREYVADRTDCIDSGRSDGNSSCSAGNPINFLTGNKLQHEIDVVIHLTRPFTISRTYNSNQKLWSFSLAPELVFTRDGDSEDIISAAVFMADGRSILFEYQNNAFTSNDHFEGELILRTIDDHPTIYPERYIYTSRDGTQYVFDGSGKSIAIIYRDGYYVEFLDNQVRDSNGLSFGVQRTDGKIDSIILADATEYSYQYNNAGLLNRVTYPDNSFKEYLYEGADPFLLTGIIDENGNRAASWTYNEDGLATSSRHFSQTGEVDVYTFDYSHFNDASNPKVTVTNPLGKNTSYYFEDMVSGRKLTRVEGHASTHCLAANKLYTYDPATGLLQSKTDWEGTETTFLYNDRGLEISRTEASGTSDARTFTTQWHTQFSLPVKIVEPEREIHMAYDDKGRVISRQVVPRS